MVLFYSIQKTCTVHTRAKSRVTRAQIPCCFSYPCSAKCRIKHVVMQSSELRPKEKSRWPRSRTTSGWAAGQIPQPNVGLKYLQDRALEVGAQWAPSLWPFGPVWLRVSPHSGAQAVSPTEMMHVNLFGDTAGRQVCSRSWDALVTSCIYWLHCLVFLLIVHSWKNPWLASGARGGFKNHPARHQPPPGTVQQLCTRDVKMHSGTVGHSPRHAILEKVHWKIRNAQICIRLTAQCCTPSHWTLNFNLFNFLNS